MSLEFKQSPAVVGNYIVDDIGTVVASLREDWLTVDTTRVTVDNTNLTVDGGSAPYYAYGHKMEVAKGLAKKNNYFQKYPLIYLVMDFPEVKKNRVLEATLNIGIISYTDKEYSAAKRYSEVFKPVLYPLYNMFFEALHKSGLFIWEGKNDLLMPEHTKIDRLFWGTGGEQNQVGQKKNSAYIFNTDPLDCIEIVGLKLNQIIK